jgi:hypothetical protein
MPHHQHILLLLRLIATKIAFRSILLGEGRGVQSSMHTADVKTQQRQQKMSDDACSQDDKHCVPTHQSKDQAQLIPIVACTYRASERARKREKERERERERKKERKKEKKKEEKKRERKKERGRVRKKKERKKEGEKEGERRHRKTYKSNKPTEEKKAQ